MDNVKTEDVTLEKVRDISTDYSPDYMSGVGIKKEMDYNKVKKRAKITLLFSIAAMIISMIFVSVIQTAGGHVTVKRMYWETEAGVGISANLYIPDTASADNPAPAVVTQSWIFK